MLVNYRRCCLLLCMALLAAVGCTQEPPANRELTPDEVTLDVQGSLPTDGTGAEITVRGRVTTLTFGQRVQGVDNYEVLPVRYLLLQTSEAQQNQSDGWGLGVELPLALLQEKGWVPAQRGDEIRVRGRLQRMLWDVALVEKPILTAISEYTIVQTAQPQRVLRRAGEPCQRDLDCADALWCERRGVCGPVPAIDWNSDLRNVNGTCLRNEDCPIGQRCDPSYKVPGDGDYSPHYFRSRDIGRFLCQVDGSATAATLCPDPVDIADLLGGRYPPGKEICVRTTIAFPLIAPDRDTHVQAEVPWPLRYPDSLPALGPFGAAMENVPMYKDPANPRGVIVDPPTGSTVLLLGTVHHDFGHGWWEIHPIKWIQREPK